MLYLDEVLDETIVEVLSTQVCVSSSCLDLKNALIYGEQGHIKSAATQVKDQDVPLASSALLVQT